MKNLSNTLNAVDVVLGTIEKVQEFDVPAKAKYVANVATTVVAVVVGFLSYISLALQLFWDEHGETVKSTAINFAIGTVEFALLLFEAGRDFRNFVAKATTRVQDELYTYSVQFGG